MSFTAGLVAGLLAAGLLAAGLLRLFYGAVRNEWPEGYSTVRDVASLRRRQQWWRYLAFRLVPVYLVSILMLNLLPTAKPAALIAVVTMLVAHLGSTHVRALVALRHLSTRRAVLTTYHVAAMLSITSTTALAWYSATLWSSLVPTFREFVLVLWTAGLAAVIAANLRRFQRGELTMERLLEGALTLLGDSKRKYAEEAARQYDTDPNVVVALLAAEVLERPGWIRSLERAKGWVMRPGTYGVAQVSSSKPISDLESIDRLCADVQGYYPALHHSRPSGARFAARIERHNPDRDFVNLVWGLYCELRPDPCVASDATARDNRPQVEVNVVERARDRWKLLGTAWLEPGDSLRFRPTGEHGHVVAEAHSASGRIDWQVSVDVNCVSVHLFVAPRGEPSLFVSPEDHWYE